MRSHIFLLHLFCSVSNSLYLFLFCSIYFPVFYLVLSYSRSLVLSFSRPLILSFSRTLILSFSRSLARFLYFNRLRELTILPQSHSRTKSRIQLASCIHPNTIVDRPVKKHRSLFEIL